jgi:hypothetical protein
MPPRFVQGDVRRLLKHFGFQRLGHASSIYVGQTFGVNRTVKFDYHSDRTRLKVGTAAQVAKSLGFKDQQAMKDYLNNNI